MQSVSAYVVLGNTELTGHIMLNSTEGSMDTYQRDIKMPAPARRYDEDIFGAIAQGVRELADAADLGGAHGYRIAWRDNEDGSHFGIRLFVIEFDSAGV
jgi:hypothetical protein